MVSRIINLTLRGFQFIWTLLIMALIGNVIADAFGGNPSLVNYTMFVAVFSMLCLFYLFAVAFNDGLSGHPIVPLALDVLNTLFFFCGAVALAAELDVHSCGNDAYTASNHLTNGAPNRNKRCTELQATTAFMWFAFATYLASSVLSGLGSGGSANLRGGIRRPNMAQV